MNILGDVDASASLQDRRKDPDLTDTATVHEITIRRVLDGPREVVCRAWTEPERLADEVQAR